MAHTCNLYVDAQPIDKLLVFVCNLFDGAKHLVAVATSTNATAHAISESRIDDTPVVTAAARTLPTLPAAGHLLQRRSFVRL